MAQRVGKGIVYSSMTAALEGVISSTLRPYFTHGKDSIPIVQETGWAPGPVWRDGKSRPTGVRSPDLPARSKPLYRLSYPAHPKESIKFKYPLDGKIKDNFAATDFVTRYNFRCY